MVMVARPNGGYEDKCKIVRLDLLANIRSIPIPEKIINLFKSLFKINKPEKIFQNNIAKCQSTDRLTQRV